MITDNTLHGVAEHFMSKNIFFKVILVQFSYCAILLNIFNKSPVFQMRNPFAAWQLCVHSATFWISFWLIHWTWLDSLMPSVGGIKRHKQLRGRQVELVLWICNLPAVATHWFTRLFILLLGHKRDTDGLTQRRHACSKLRYVAKWGFQHRQELRLLTITTLTNLMSLLVTFICSLKHENRK